MMPFITRKRHEAEMAAKDVLIDSLDKTAAAFRKDRDQWRDAHVRLRAERDTLQSRLDALTPARGQGGRFVGKAVSHG